MLQTDGRTDTHSYVVVTYYKIDVSVCFFYLSLNANDDDSAFLYEKLDVRLLRHPSQLASKPGVNLPLSASDLKNGEEE